MRRFKRVIAVVITVSVMMGPAPASDVVVAENSMAEVQHINGYIDTDMKVKLINKTTSMLKSSALPAKYSSVDKGYVTGVKNQGMYGTCWAHTAIATIESYILAHGYEKQTEDNPDGINLSEYALIYAVNSDDMYYEETGDRTYTGNISNAFNSGGNDQNVYKALSKWTGLVKEDTQKDLSTYGDEITITEDDIAYILTGQQYISMSDVAGVKQKIMENGAVAGSYFSDDMFALDTSDFVHYYIYNYDTDYLYTNHAITIVGWDDTIPKENFAIEKNGVTYTPSKDGAWYVKNSWGTYFGDGGYMWISYEDVSIKDSTAVVYEVVPRDTYDKNYQHDGATIFGGSAIGGTEFANVFTVSGENKETIEAVSFALLSTDVEYSIQIYKNPEEDNPDSGEECLTTPVTGVTTYEGYYTIELNEDITVNPGDTFAVVIKFTESAFVVRELYEGINEMSPFIIETATDENESYMYFDYFGWLDMNDTSVFGYYEARNSNLVIKAFTNTIEASGEDDEQNPDDTTTSYICGDANGDGKISIVDAILIKRYIAGYENLNINLEASNVNGDTKVNVLDAILVMRYLAGYDVVLG